jgi:hypothetical protein
MEAMGAAVMNFLSAPRGPASSIPSTTRHSQRRHQVLSVGDSEMEWIFIQYGGRLGSGGAYMRRTDKCGGGCYRFLIAIHDLLFLP